MPPPLPQDQLPKGNLKTRLFKPRVAWMLVRNTVVSTAMFLVFGLGLMWLLVEKAGVHEIVATGASFITANSCHYIFGRLWIYRGTERPVAEGFALFLMNGLAGLSLTVAAMALLREYTAIDLYVARILVSVIAGLMMFVLNAVWNFRRV
jgi:putative flippase GtrA